MNSLKLAILIYIFLISFSYAEEVNQKDYIGNTFKILQNTTPQQEFKLGTRLASETIVDEMYYSKSARVKYLNFIVNTLVLSSNRPYLYNGYKVILLRNKEFNAYAYPGGIIVVNDGVFKHLSNEDQLAAILAHEIGHIQEKHNIDTDKNFKVNDTLNIATAIGIEKNVNNKYAQSIAHGVLGQLTNSIIKGYNVEQEAEADQLGMTLLTKAGYDPNEFLNTLTKLKEITNSYGGANYPKNRLLRLEKLIQKLEYNQEEINKAKRLRVKRFRKYK